MSENYGSDNILPEARKQRKQMEEQLSALAKSPAPEADSNSDTPRTDAAIKESDGQWSFALRAVSRQLERELAKAIKEQNKWEKSAMEQSTSLHRELANCILARQQLAMATKALRDIVDEWPYHADSPENIRNTAKQALAAIKPAPPMSDK